MLDFEDCPLNFLVTPVIDVKEKLNQSSLMRKFQTV